MDVRELRIGNWVKEHWDNSRPFKVESIDDLRVNLFATDSGCSYGMHYGIIDSDYDLDNLVGIPLTEEILLKCEGWKKVKEGTFCNDEDEIRVEFNRRGFIQLLLGFDLNDGTNWMHITELEYLHQLQNAYPILKDGEELNIEL